MGVRKIIFSERAVLQQHSHPGTQQSLSQEVLQSCRDAALRDVGRRVS